MNMYNSKRFLAVITMLGIFGVVSACSPRAQTSGNLPDPKKVSELKTGDISREEVIEFLGSPSSVTSFGDEVWFYISEKTETLGWFEPKVKNRLVLALYFSNDGTLSEIKTSGLDESKKIIPIDRKTLTHGSKMTVFEQLVGNFRRFTDD
jgi:outer membrane protein assembly factor BamE (lipoprotein component of BamABCDE complex)